jgi:hypothetical protein
MTFRVPGIFFSTWQVGCRNSETYMDMVLGGMSRKTKRAKLVPTFVDRGCQVVGMADPYGRILDFLDRSHYFFGRILDFLDRSRYFFIQVAPQLYSRGWVDPVPDPLLLRKSGSAGNLSRDLWICSQELRRGRVVCLQVRKTNPRPQGAFIMWRAKHGDLIVILRWWKSPTEPAADGKSWVKRRKLCLSIWLSAI